MMLKLVYIAAGGALGSVARYLVGGWVQERFAHSVFPYGTLVVNLLGCLLIGILWELYDEFKLAPEIRLFVFIGVLGGFTTFSSFAWESRNLLQDGEIGAGLMNVLASNVAGIVLVFAGAIATRGLLKLFR